MSSIFSRLNVLSPYQHDSECLAPTEFIRPATPDYLRPNTKDTADDDPDMFSVPPSSSGVTKVKSSDWLSRITAKQIERNKVHTKNLLAQAAALDKQTKIKVGCFVKTRNKMIAPLSKHVRNKRKVRTEVFGTVVARSEFQPRFWLVSFKNGKQFYCTDKVLNFVSLTSPTHDLTVDNDNMLRINKVKQIHLNQERIIKVLLCSRIHDIPGHPKITFNTLLAIFKPQFPWLTMGKFKYQASLMKKTINDHSQDSWLSIVGNNNTSTETQDNNSVQTNSTENTDFTSSDNKNTKKNTKSVNSIDSALDETYESDSVPQSVLIRRIGRGSSFVKKHYKTLFCDTDDSDSDDSVPKTGKMRNGKQGMYQ